MGEKYILDWEEYTKVARKVVAEGCVLLRNEKNVLPLQAGEKISIFGRIQNHYYKSGTGSGGLVNVNKVVSIVDGLRESRKVEINEELVQIYEAWEVENPFEEGMGWGNEPWSQKEMPVTEEMVQKAGAVSDTAIVIIGRTAGEDQDVSNEPGSFLLTETEMDLMRKVRSHFSKMVVLLNVGGFMDMHFVDEISPEAVMYVWQGGMVGGSGTADVLTGEVSPSGRLTDTIAYELSDYPSDSCFGDTVRNFYQEDIYVGYRYFETFAKERVRYPFGYGLSYTQFSQEVLSAEVSLEKKLVEMKIRVKNIGAVEGREVVQIYVNPAQGVLGKPVKNLIDFKKTACLAPQETETLLLQIPFFRMASYDDSGITGKKSCWLLEAGQYQIYFGANAAEVQEACTFEIPNLLVLEQLEEALAPVQEFEVISPVLAQNGEQNTFQVAKKKVSVATIDMDERRKELLPSDIPFTGDQGIMLKDVFEKRATMEAFVAQLTDEDLCAIVRGEGMSSSLVTAGTASALGGVSKSLRQKGIPAVCCDDGPSGMRLDSGAKAFSLPNGTMIACTFDTELIECLYQFTALEMIHNKVECLLGPGMNIHRHPLNGRNFEYFSEDPFLTGKMASAMVSGLQKHGVTGTVKHFCANNQEKRRHDIDSVVSERALREIYLKGFEMVVKEAKASTVMTTYGSVNGLWTAGSYDLVTTILRKQWGFDGIVMTDWWAKINERGKEANQQNFAAMVRAQNDLYMCCPNGESFESGENTLEALQAGTLTRGELQRTAGNVCRFAMQTQAMKRLLGDETFVEIIHNEQDESQMDLSQLEYVEVEESITISLREQKSKKDTNYIFPLDVKKPGIYKVTLRGKSDLGDLAQMSATLFLMGSPLHVFTFHGTQGKEVALEAEAGIFSRFAVFRLVVGSNGLDLNEITFTYDHEWQ